MKERLDQLSFSILQSTIAEEMKLAIGDGTNIDIEKLTYLNGKLANLLEQYLEDNE